MHVHVSGDGADAKLWLSPEVSIAYNRGFGARLLAELMSVAEARQDEIEAAWNGHFGQTPRGPLR